MHPREQRNAAFYSAGDLLWGFSAMLVAPATVLTVLLSRYGAGEAMIGAIVAIQSGALTLPQLVGLHLFRSKRARKRSLVVWHLATVPPLLFFSGVLAGNFFHWPDHVVRWGLLGSYGLATLAVGIITAVWIDWVAQVFDQAIRGTVLGLSMASAAAGYTVAALASGAMLAWFYPDITVYTWLYAGAGLAAVAAMLLYGRVRDPAQEADDQPISDGLLNVIRRFGHSLASSNFRWYLLGRVLAASGFCILPFITLHFLSPAGGSLTSGWIVAFSSAQAVFTAIASFSIGRIGDRLGHRLGAVVGGLTQIATLALLLVGAGPIACLLTFAATGVCIGASNVSNYNLVIETCPHESRIAHITVANLVLSPFNIVVPIAAGAVAMAWGLPVLFAVSLALSILALLVVAMRVREPRTLIAFPQATGPVAEAGVTQVEVEPVTVET